MKRNRQLFHIWRNLRLWQRLIVECTFCLIITLAVGLVLLDSTIGETIFQGLFMGIFFTIIDHAFFAPKKKNREQDSRDSSFEGQ